MKHIYSIQLFANTAASSLPVECRKVGDAEEVLVRLAQHRNAVTQRFQNMLDLELPANIRDYQVHAFLKTDPKIMWDGEADEGWFTGREVFYMKDHSDPRYIDEQVSKFATGQTDFYLRKLSFNFYEKQQQAFDWAFNRYNANSKRLLVEAVPRFGKSFLALKIAQAANARTVLILTPFPDADASFSDIIRRHVGFAGATYSDIRDGLPAESGFQVIKASWQILDDTKDSCKALFAEGVDFIVVDETHRASDTLRSEAYLKLIPHKHELHLSGTPYADKLIGRFTIDDIWTYDVVDQLKAIRAAPKDSPLASYPLPKLYLIDGMLEATKRFQELYPTMQIEDNLTLEKFFDPKYENLVEAFFRNLTSTTHDPLAKRLMTNTELARRMDHILLFAPSCAAADLITRVLQRLTAEGGGWGGYHVSAISGLEEVGSFDSAETEINRLQSAYAKTLVVSVGKATTGVTLDRLQSIWILRKMNSAEQFVQTLFRAGTPYPGKAITPIICFDSESALIAQATVALQHAQATKQSFPAAVKTLYECLPTFVWDASLAFTPLDAELALAFTKQIKAQLLSRDDIGDLPEGFLDHIKLTDKAIRAQLGIGGQAGGKTKQVTKAAAAKQKAELDSKARVLQVLSWLDWVVLGRSVRTVEDLRSISDADCNGYLQISKDELHAIIDVVGLAAIQKQLDFFVCKLLSI